MFKKLITMMTTSYHAHNPFMRPKVNKYNIFVNLYRYYREERIARKKIQNYAERITKQCEYEKMKYGYIIDHSSNSWFAGIIPKNWRELIIDRHPTHEDWTIRELNSLADYVENLRKK